MKGINRAPSAAQCYLYLDVLEAALRSIADWDVF